MAVTGWCGAPNWASQQLVNGSKQITMTPTEFERHAGMATSKKWKHTVRVDTGSDDPPAIGAWMASRGLLTGPDRWPPFRTIIAS